MHPSIEVLALSRGRGVPEETQAAFDNIKSVVARMQSDGSVIASAESVIGLEGARVIEETIRETLPEGFQRAEYLLEHGMIDMVVERRELRDTVTRILTLLADKAPAAEVVPLPAGEAKIPMGQISGQESAEQPQDKAAE